MTQPAAPLRQAVWALAFCAVLGMAFTAAPLAAEPPDPEPSTAPEPARFFLEEILIEGIQRGSQQVVLAESRLRTGSSYSEDQLRDAVVRIHRLPFVLTSEFSLGKGSERGRYVLKIRVFETHRLFYAVDRRYTQVDEPVILDGDVARDDTSSLRATAGYRIRLGAYGEAVLAADSEQGLQAGYTHYDLLGRGATASLGVAKDYDDSSVVLPLGIDPRFSVWRLDEGELVSARLAVPLSGNHGLLLRGEWLHGDSGTERDLLGGSLLADRVNERTEIDVYEASASWVWDDSDDPLIPRSGRAFELGLELIRLDAGGVSSTLTSPAAPPQTLDSNLAGFDSQLARAVARAALHRPLGSATSLTWRGTAAVGTARVTGLPIGTEELGEQTFGTVELGLGATARYTLWQPAERFETLWLEGLADVSHQVLDLEHPTIDDSVTQGRVGLRLTLRDSWGVLRAGLYYVAVDGSGP